MQPELLKNDTIKSWIRDKPKFLKVAPDCRRVIALPTVSTIKNKIPNNLKEGYKCH